MLVVSIVLFLALYCIYRTFFNHPEAEAYVKFIEIRPKVHHPSRTFVIIHGLNSSSQNLSSLAEVVKAAYHDAQVLLIDWSYGAKTGIPWPAGRRTKGVGYELAQQLSQMSIDFETTTFIGHSFGSYVAGWAAVYAKTNYQQTTGGIIGLGVANSLGGAPYTDFKKYCRAYTAYVTNSILDSSWSDPKQISKRFASQVIHVDMPGFSLFRRGHRSTVKWLKQLSDRNQQVFRDVLDMKLKGGDGFKYDIDGKRIVSLRKEVEN